MSEENKLSKDSLDRWLITAMSHMKTMYEDEGIPWDEENEAHFQAIRGCIESSEPKEPSEAELEEFVENKTNRMEQLFLQNTRRGDREFFIRVEVIKEYDKLRRG